MIDSSPFGFGDPLATRYTEIERVVSPYREQVEYPSLMRALGQVRGASALDLGCGFGPFTRLLRRQGAAQVLGVDASSEAVQAARRLERQHPIGVRYQVHDIAALPLLGTFDVITAANVLHYADRRETLRRMCECAFTNLAPGGRLLALVANPYLRPGEPQFNGFVLHRPAQPPDGYAFDVTLPVTPPVKLTVHHWSCEAYEEVLGECGFTDLTWEPMVGLPEDGPHRPVSLLIGAHRPLGRPDR
ncbi:class I SAM-dependent methyltransferase [Actinomadura rugatobispora]|uniref:Class I SAM-dependent methyltransferase n=1 Tax=Actinomadura rugatobispora TaxID=1994 RepID=A0ABW0ZYE2_9ACTN|nr:class I SAM-dependent methyltransferase [Actinomadura rugatobispora]